MRRFVTGGIKVVFDADGLIAGTCFLAGRRGVKDYLEDLISRGVEEVVEAYETRPEVLH
jgi:hypothetical protein